MHRNILSLLLIAVFMIGCTHAKPFHNEAEDQQQEEAQQESMTQYCPVAVFKGNTQVETPACDEPVSDDIPNVDTSPYNLDMRVYEKIRLQREALFACYAALPENQQKNGMFFADIVINSFGKAEKITWINASVNPDIPALDAPPEMLSCFNGVLSDITFPKQGDQQRVIRGYFLAYHRAGDADNPKKPEITAIKNQWDLKSLQTSNPYGKPETYFNKTGIDRSIISMAIRRKLGKIRLCYQKELNKNHNLYGKIVIKFSFGSTGRVRRASMQNTTMHNAAVEDCIAGVIKNIIFPKPKGGGILVVSYPFVFKPVD